MSTTSSPSRQRQIGVARHDTVDEASPPQPNFQRVEGAAVRDIDDAVDVIGNACLRLSERIEKQLDGRPSHKRITHTDQLDGGRHPIERIEVARHAPSARSRSSSWVTATARSRAFPIRALPIRTASTSASSSCSPGSADNHLGHPRYEGIDRVPHILSNLRSPDEPLTTRRQQPIKRRRRDAVATPRPSGPTTPGNTNLTPCASSSSRLRFEVSLRLALKRSQRSNRRTEVCTCEGDIAIAAASDP